MKLSLPGFLPFRRTPAASPDPGSVAAVATRSRRAGWKLPFAGDRRWLLLAWDIAGMRGVLAEGDRLRCRIVARAQSSEAHFAAALADVLEQLRASGEKLPRRVALAARHLRPALVDLPVNPDKPRPDAQMRELLRADMEPALAEFGSLWTMGALLHARGHLSAADRDRVVLEGALRRESRRTPLRYGETALELALIDRATLNECLELQENLQYLDGDLTSGWKGYVEHGEKRWLASALPARLYRQWGDALAGQGMRLETVLPLAWLASDAVPAANSAGQAADVQQLAIELHSEEVLVVRRQNGRIVAARNEGRMERPLQSDWLLRLLDDWGGEMRAEIALYCLDAADEFGARQAASELELESGQPARVVDAPSTWDALWPALLREATRVPPEHRLPRLAARELRGNPWKNPDILRVAAIAVLVGGLAVTEGVQRYQLGRLRQTLTEKTKKEGEQQQRTQLTLKASAEVQQIGRELETARAALEPLINERARLEAIAAMRQYLPDLMLTLAQATGNDAVLEKIGNSRSGNDATAIRVEAWSPTYTGAQDFVNRVAERATALSYGVAQTEIREERGRTDKPGYRVGFWLVQEGGELEQGAAAPAGSEAARPANSGISSQQKGTP